MKFTFDASCMKGQCAPRDTLESVDRLRWSIVYGEVRP